MEHMEDVYKREVCKEPFILEPEDWTPEEWRTLCKLCGLPDAITERIVIHASEIESYVGEHITIELGWPKEAVELFREAVSETSQEGTHRGDKNRTYIVTEFCPHCESEIEMRWNTDTDGYQAFCPVCGNRLMLCDECHHTDGNGGCDYDSATDTCRFSANAARWRGIG